MRAIPSRMIEFDAPLSARYNEGAMNGDGLPEVSSEEGARRVIWVTFFLLFFLALLLGTALVRLYTNWLWFTDVGYRDVFVKTTAIKVILTCVTFLLFFGFVQANLLLAQHLHPRPTLYLDDQHQFRLTLTQFGRQGLSLVLLLTTFVVSLTVALAAAKGWYDYVLFRNPVAFGLSDPILGRDLGFYVFQLPFIRFVYRWLAVGLGLSLFAVAALYWFDRAIDFVAGQVRVTAYARAHLSVLLAGLLGLKAWGYWLGRYEILFTPHRLFFGAAFVDVHVRLSVLHALVFVAAAAAIAVLVSLRLRSMHLALWSVTTWLGVSLLGQGVLPALVQKVRVTPNELAAEQPFITHSIQATRTAYGLSHVRQRPFPAAGTLSMADIRNNLDTVRSIRLWDYEPLLDAYRQIQTIRAYYTFHGADVDRYPLEDGIRQVALSVRELDVQRLGGAERSWINRHLIYTHGYGLCMSPVDRVAEGGLPDLIIKDFPPQTPPGMVLRRPQIYFGELTDDYVIVNTTEEEFDYPAGDQNMTCRYEGGRGVRLGGFWRRFLLALRFADQNILLSRHLHSESRVLFARNIEERAKLIAPFLRLDGDPYPVVFDGRIVWVIDAYTTSPRYPYSQPIQPDPPRFDNVFNYIRNAVKITVDAYDGTTTFYVADEEDPIVRSLRAAFPDLFVPLQRMPDGLKTHLRYPKDLFTFQASIYAGYHMTDPRVFYNREDMWEVPRMRGEAKDSLGLPARKPPMSPYYMIMKLPGGTKPEYILMLPFTPIGEKQNMIAWMAARCDGQQLGEVVVYNFPKQKLVYGPIQIDALIDQHPQISERLTLWNQSGSEVIRAPVMVIPIEDSVLYVEPLYLRASTGRMPELKKVIVAYGSQVEMGDTLWDGLERLFREPAAATRVPGSPDKVPPPAKSSTREGTRAVPPEVRRLVAEAVASYDRAQTALRKGDWATYGAEMQRVQNTLHRLRALASE